MLALYHAPFSVSSQSVRMTLAEKNLTWEDRLIDLLAGDQLKPAYLKINPRGEVPVLVHGEAVLAESAAINEYVDESFPGTSLVPSDPLKRHRMRCSVTRTQNLIHQAAGVLTYAVLARPLLQAVPKEALESMFELMPDPRVKAWRRSVLALGLQAPEVAVAIDQHRQFLAQLEQSLPTQHSWLAGDGISLADITALPYVMRADHVGLGALFPMDKAPNLRSWYMRMSSRPSIQTSLLRYVDEASQTLLMKLAVQAQPELAPLMNLG
jgi:glutathione S-transferase